jgi:hypothetical protein
MPDDLHQTTTLTPERALEIAAVMAECWFIREGTKDGPLPDIRGFSCADAVQASYMMMQLGLGRSRLPDGSTALQVFVEPTRVPALYSWALATWADEGRIS